MENLKLNLELELGLKVNYIKDDNSGYEDDVYLNINDEIDIFEGAYQKWDVIIEEGDIEKSFMSDEELIMFLKDYIKE